MVNITFRPDDSGLQSLKQENATAPANRAPAPLQAVSRVPSVSEEPPTPPKHPTQSTTAYMGPERRKGERRTAQARGIPDTRGKRERRRQLPDSPEGEDIPPRGVDLYG